MSTKIQALLLAAGEGSRLRPYTADRPKCLVELHGVSLVHRQLRVLRDAGIDRIHIVSGYRADQIARLGLETYRNERFDRTNMVYSMMRAREILDGRADTLICYADIVYEPRVLRALLDCPHEFATVVDLGWRYLWEARNENPLLDAETLRLDEHGSIRELGKKPRSLDEIEGQYIGLTRFAAQFCRTVVSAYDNLDPDRLYDGKDKPNMYMTSFLQHLIDQGHDLWPAFTRGGWLEVDTNTDLDHYNELARKGELGQFYDCA